MIEHLPPDKIDRFIERSLAPDELLAAARHLSDCEECRQKINQAKNHSAQIHHIREELNEAGHLSYEQIEAYVDYSLTDAERLIVKKHLDLCAACVKESRDLESFRDDLAVYPKTATRSESRQKFLSAFQVKHFRIVWATAVLLIVLIGTVFYVWRSSNPPEIAQIPNEDNRNDAQPAPPSGDQHAASPAPPNSNTAARESEYESVIRQAVAAERIAQPAAIRDLTGKASTLMGKGEDSTFALLGPAGTLIMNDRPTFRWQALAGAISYKVSVLDTSFNVVIESAPVAQTEWQASRALERNKIYLWQVTAIRDGREVIAPISPQPEARFKIISQAKARELRQPANESHLRAGIIYAHNGLLDDAERELQTAIEKGEQSALAGKLLESVKAMRR